MRGLPGAVVADGEQSAEVAVVDGFAVRLALIFEGQKVLSVHLQNETCPATL